MKKKKNKTWMKLKKKKKDWYIGGRNKGVGRDWEMRNKLSCERRKKRKGSNKEKQKKKKK